MKLFTINATTVRPELTEYGNHVRLEGYPKTVARVLANHGIDGFTMYQVQGYWKGVPEVSFKIEIATEAKNAHTINLIAEELRDEYSQDSVMVTYPDNHVEFVERP